MNVNELLFHILFFNPGKGFYRFSNADGKVWLMPIRKMRVAMNLYQPSGRNGKLMKMLFPWLHRIPFVRNVIHAESLHCDLKDELKRLFARLFHEAEPEFSIFCGTPGVHQKITIQISKGRRILGYCKATDNGEVAALFQNEADILERLSRKGMKGIPECLLCGDLSNGIKLFVQSTMKTRKSQVVHEWTALHEDFLDKLYRSTRQSIVFEESDYYKTLIDLQQHSNWLPKEVDCILVITVIRRILSQYQGQGVDFSAYHADFTPWNMFVENGQLFVFDWEYARMTYPPLLDRYHFFTQTAIFERHWQADQIVFFLQSPQADWINKETYIFYLLDMIARFTLREKGSVNGEIACSMKIWNDLLIYL